MNMSEREPKGKRDFERQVGKAKAARRGGKYIIEIGDQRLVLDLPDDLIYVQAAIQQIMDEEWREMLEERRARGQKTYVEYRGGEVVQEY